jgi:hypothetical protein
VDNLYAWHSQETERLTVNQFTVSTFGAHFYDSVLVLEKRPIEQPKVSMTGKPSF